MGDTKADTVTAVNVAKDIMSANPDLAAFVGTDSTAGIGAATAVEEAGKVGQVKVVAMDRNSDILQKIKDGTLTGTVAQDDAAMAFWCLQVLYNFNHYPGAAHLRQQGCRRHHRSDQRLHVGQLHRRDQRRLLPGCKRDLRQVNVFEAAGRAVLAHLPGLHYPPWHQQLKHDGRSTAD